MLLVLGLVACDREAREVAPVRPARAAIARPSPPPSRPALDEELLPTDDDGFNAVAGYPTGGLVAVDRPTSDIASTDGTDDRPIAADVDSDDIPDVLDKCPDVPDDDDEDIDGCPEPSPST